MTAWLPLSVLAGLASALIVGGLGQSFALALAVSPFTSLPLFLTGLGLGLMPVVVAGLVGTLATAFLGSIGFGVGFALQYAVPVILVTRLALLSRSPPSGDVEWYPPGGLLFWLMALIAGYFIAVWGYLELTTEGLGHVLATGLREMLDVFEPRPALELEAKLKAQVAYVPGVGAVYLILLVLLNGGLAQRILRRFGRNLRPSPRLDQLVLPGWLAIVFLLVVLAASFLEPLRIPGLTLAFIFGLGYSLLGLAVVHTFYRARPAAPFGLVGFYVMLAVMLVVATVMAIALWAALVLVAVGLAEQFLGLRARMGWQGP